MKIYGQHEENTLEQFDFVMKNAEKGALMADGHFGYIMPVGGVVAYKGLVSPAGVGYDISCGNKAVKLNCKSDDIKPYLDTILDTIQNRISFGIGQNNNVKVKNELFDDDDAWKVYEDKYERDALHKLARDQLGTVGSGNHYVDIFEDEEGWAWIGVHFGSRGFGHKTCTGFMNLAVNGKWIYKPLKDKEVLFDITTDIGERYYNAMKLAGRYAYAGRDWVCKTVAGIVGGDIVDEVHNHHNYAWEEEHDGEMYIVVRKGATPAFPGQRGFVGGSMGDDAVIVEGVDSEDSKKSLYSTVHGAGRVMSRTKAAGKFRWKKVDGKRVRVQKSEGVISWNMLNEWISEKGVKLRGGGTDEAPQAYRRLTNVLREHEGTIRILHTLKPLGVIMAGENEFDPYKD